MAKKYFTLSFDDGLEQDKRIIEILKRYQLSATFNLNAGLFGEEGMIGRIGNYGIKYVPEARNSFWMKYCHCNRIPEDEVKQVYHGFEIASHAYRHENLKELDADMLKEAIEQDIQKLSEIAGYKIVGHAYPSGAYSDEVEVCLREHQIEYARCVASSKNFQFPKNPLQYKPTAWFIEKDLFSLADKFLKSEAQEDQIFYVWGHGYEFDFGTKQCNWYQFEKFCELMAGRSDITYCNNRDAFRMHKEAEGTNN